MDILINTLIVILGIAFGIVIIRFPLLFILMILFGSW